VTEAAAPIERTIPGLTPGLKRRLRASFACLSRISPTLAARVALRLFTRPLPRPLTAEDREFLARARSTTLDTAAGTVRVYEWPGAGATVLLVHGWRSHSGRLRHLIESLHQRDLNVVAFDAPGHGHSSGRRLDIEIHRGTISAVSRIYGPFDAVLAHSFGALSSLSWLAQSADAGTVRAAVLIGVPRDAGFLFDGFVEVLGLSAPVIERMRTGFHRRFGSEPERFCAREFARRVRPPVLLLHGGADELVPAAHSVEVAACLADARVQVIADFSHGAPLRDPRSVRAATDFIAAHLWLPLPQ
jgi:pimeloyl-ACP methyl ester carboxylesterase